MMTSLMKLFGSCVTIIVTARATSAGDSMRSFDFVDLLPDPRNEVFVEPGQIRLTRIPCWRTSSASACENPTTPNFDAQYTARFAEPTFPAMEAMLMIWPVPLAIMEGRTAR